MPVPMGAERLLPHFYPSVGDSGSKIQKGTITKMFLKTSKNFAPECLQVKHREKN